MNTPTHAILGLALLPKQDKWGGAGAIVLGGFLPDLPMFGFYAYQKLIGTPEREIWGDHYFRDSWQLLFDVFNSFPLFIGLLLVSWWAGWQGPFFQWMGLLSASALLHLACDLPVHFDDSHRHFLPFSNWRFQSPVSYWDPRHYGRQFATLEALLALGLSIWLLLPGNTWPNRVFAGVGLPLFVVQTVAVVWFAMTYCSAVNDQLPSAPTEPAATASERATSSSSTP